MTMQTSDYVEYKNKQFILVDIELGTKLYNEDNNEKSDFTINTSSWRGYEAKYKNAASKTKIPSGIEQEEEIKKLAIKAFKAIDGKGLARVDFFVIQEKIYLNEINTIPGFKNISMYAKLWEASGIPYAQLIDELIQLT